MAQKAGLSCKMYLMSSGTWGSASAWTLYDDVENLSIGGERTKIPVNKRGDGYRRFLTGLKERGVTFSMVRDLADTDQIALETACDAGTDMIFAFADGPIATTGTRYVKMEMKVSKFAESEPLEGPAMVDVELVLSATSTNAPTRVTV